VSGIHHSIFIEKKIQWRISFASNYFYVLPWCIIIAVIQLVEETQTHFSHLCTWKKIRQNVVVVFVYITLFWGSAKVRIRAQNIAHCQGSQSNCKSFFLNKQNKKVCVYIFQQISKFEWRWILRFFDSCIYWNYSSLLVVLVNFLYI